MRRVFVDAGPIVALLEQGDRRHHWMRDLIASTQGPLFTCEPVLTEATHIMRRRSGGRAAVLDLLGKGFLALGFRVEPEVDALQSLISRYDSVPMSLADACLVRMTELTPDSAVLTFDTDFRIYRRGGRHAIPVIMPGRN
ncbi:MAG: PIN domain-containing protein [Gemmatimonadota bacterium]